MHVWTQKAVVGPWLRWKCCHPNGPLPPVGACKRTNEHGVASLPLHALSLALPLLPCDVDFKGTLALEAVPHINILKLGTSWPALSSAASGLHRLKVSLGITPTSR